MVWHCLSTPFQQLPHHPEYFVSGALVADPLGLLRHGGSIPKVAHLPHKPASATPPSPSPRDDTQLPAVPLSPRPAGLPLNPLFPPFFPPSQGEMCVWAGLFVMAGPAVWTRCTWTLASPFFTFFLLRFLSGEQRCGGVGGGGRLLRFVLLEACCVCAAGLLRLLHLNVGRALHCPLR